MALGTLLMARCNFSSLASFIFLQHQSSIFCFPLLATFFLLWPNCSVGSCLLWSSCLTAFSLLCHLLCRCHWCYHHGCHSLMSLLLLYLFISPNYTTKSRPDHEREGFIELAFATSEEIKVGECLPAGSLNEHEQPAHIAREWVFGPITDILGGNHSLASKYSYFTTSPGQVSQLTKMETVALSYRVYWCLR